MFRLTFIVLAAGYSNRFGEADKRTLLINNKTSLLEHVVEQIPKIEYAESIIVVRDKAKWQSLDLIPNTKLIENPEAKTGMKSSLLVALNALSPETTAFMVCLADMPLLRTPHYLELINTFKRSYIDDNPLIVMPKVNQSLFGHPRLFSHHFKNVFLSSPKDVPNKELIKQSSANVQYLETQDEAYLLDIDEQKDLNILSRI